MARRGIEDKLNNGAQEGLDINQLFDSAIDNGLKALSERHLGYTPKTLAKYIDKNEVRKYTAIISKEMKKYQAQGKDINDFAQKVYTGLASLAASGEFFNEDGINLIFRKSLRRKLGGRKAREVLEGEKYLEDAMLGFRKLYDLTGSEEFREQLPELSNAVRALYKIK